MNLTAANHVVVIGSVPLGSALRAQLDAKPNARIFAEADFLRALEIIIADVPQLIAIDPEFAATARGAALVARVKTDPRLSGSEIRAFVTDSDNGAFLSAPFAVHSGNSPAVLQPVDRCGTRAATRFTMGKDAEVRVNGSSARLVNLSITGAQVLVPFRLRPSEEIRLTLIDDPKEIRLTGSIAWITLEIAKGGQRYRFGVEFKNPEPLPLERYCLRYRQDADKVPTVLM